jgi:hypothetical protein
MARGTTVQGMPMKTRLITRLGRRSLLLGGVVTVLLGGAGYLTLSPRQDPLGGGMFCHSGKCCKVCPADLAKTAAAGDRPVLNPLMFVGPARQAYIILSKVPGCWRSCGATAVVTAPTATAVCSTVIGTTTARLARSAPERRWRLTSFSTRALPSNKSATRYGCAFRVIRVRVSNSGNRPVDKVVQQDTSALMKFSTNGFQIGPGRL